MTTITNKTTVTRPGRVDGKRDHQTDDLRELQRTIYDDSRCVGAALSQHFTAIQAEAVRLAGGDETMADALFAAAKARLAALDPSRYDEDNKDEEAWVRGELFAAMAWASRVVVRRAA